MLSENVRHKGDESQGMYLVVLARLPGFLEVLLRFGHVYRFQKLGYQTQDGQRLQVITDSGGFNIAATGFLIRNILKDDI